MADQQTGHARLRRQLQMGGGAAASMAAVIVLAAADGSIGAGIAAAGCAALALIAGASYAIVRQRLGTQVREDALVSGQMVAAFLLLAWLSSEGAAASPAMVLLYPVVMLFGALSLVTMQLVILAAVALVLQGTALFAFIGGGGRLSLGEAGTQLGALALMFAWFILATGTVRRLRARLAEARGALHDAGVDAHERASRDALTGAYHHRHLMEALEREIARAERVGKPLSVARVDLDWLGSINHSHGQVAGDVALRRFTAAAGAALRDVDILGRYGGKEFLVLMPDTDLKGAVIAGERVRAGVGAEPAPEVDGRKRLSCTLGIAEHRKGENTRLLIGRAEAGLNYAKAAGRDRVVALGTDGNPVLVEAG